MKRIVAAAIVGLLLSGCATQYGSAGFTGGHFETTLPVPLTKVTFAGNGYIDAATVQKYALYRCAEVAQARGRPYFTLYESLRHAALDAPSAMPLVGSMGNKPLASAFIRLLDTQEKGALNTQEVLATYGPLVKGVQNTTAAAR